MLYTFPKAQTFPCIFQCFVLYYIGIQYIYHFKCVFMWKKNEIVK